MKNTIVLLCILLSGAIHGQNTEAYVTYGTQFLRYNVPTDQNNFIKRTYKWPINYSNPAPLRVPNSIKSFLISKGIFTAGYNVRKGRHVYGALFTYEKQLMAHKTSIYKLGTIDVDVVNGEVVETEQNLVDEFVGFRSWSDSNIKNYNLAVRYDFNWIFKDKLKVYSGLSLGARVRRSSTIYYDIASIQDQYPDEVLEDFYRDKNSELNHHLHFNIIGVRFGHIWAVVAELGYGNRGFVNFGVNHLLFASPKWIDKKAAKKASKNK